MPRQVVRQQHPFRLAPERFEDLHAVLFRQIEAVGHLARQLGIPQLIELSVNLATEAHDVLDRKNDEGEN